MVFWFFIIENEIRIIFEVFPILKNSAFHYLMTIDIIFKNKSPFD